MMKTTLNIEVVDKIDVEELIKDFKILSLDNFNAYLKEVWRVSILEIFNLTNFKLNYIGSSSKIR